LPQNKRVGPVMAFATAKWDRRSRDGLKPDSLRRRVALP